MTADISDDRVRRLLEYDPLQEAKVEAEMADGDWTLRGFRNVHASTEAKKKALLKREDTFWGCPIDYFRDILSDDGFVLLEERADEGLFSNYLEQLHWHPRDGILLSSSSHLSEGDASPHLGSASLVFNCLVPFGKWDELRGVPCSQAPVTLPSGEEYACRHTLDGREALRFKLKMLRMHGAFVVPWVFAGTHPYPLTFYGEHRRCGRLTADSLDEAISTRRELSKERAARMHEEVRNCLAICHEDRR
jgi:hypothetical protein